MLLVSVFIWGGGGSPGSEYRHTPSKPSYSCKIFVLYVCYTAIKK